MFEISEEEVQQALPVNQAEEAQPEIDNERPDEAVLTAEIDDLWQDHEAYKSSIKQESQTLRALRAELGERLYGIKQLLARPGRGGQWSAWLKKRLIPRATADRLVQKHEQLLNPDNNCLTDAISEPTEEDIQKLVASVMPKLRKTLRTEASVSRFIDQLSRLLEGEIRGISIASY